MLDENLIAELVRQRVVTDTFRRLPPEKKERVYLTAMRLFGRWGYDGLAVDRFASEAGISKGSFFQYFPAKSHLLEFVILIFDRRLVARYDELRRKETVVLARQKLARLFHALAADAKAQPVERTFYLFVRHAIAHAGVVIEGVDLTRHLGEYAREIVQRGMQTGEIRSDVKAESIARLIVALTDSVGFVDSDPELSATLLFEGVKA